MKYKITLINQLKAIDLLIFIYTLIFIVAVYNYKTNNLDKNLIEGLVLFALITLLPVLYLHIEYYYYNRNIELQIDTIGKKFNYTNSLRILEQLDFDEITKAVLFMPPHFHSNKLFIRIPFDNYHYVIFYTISGKEIIITSLMEPKLQDLILSIKGVTVEKKKRIFASILLS